MIETPLTNVSLSMDMPISVGFGDASVTKDGVVAWYESYYNSTTPITVADAERMAQADPDHDWRIHLVAPLHENHYQRQGEGAWMLYQTGLGFA
jgi:hypothetical protein